jgi:hypothetical protein
MTTGIDTLTILSKYALMENKESISKGVLLWEIG